MNQGNLTMDVQKTVATHSSTLAWQIPPSLQGWRSFCRLQSMESLRVGQNWVTLLSLFTFMHWRRKWQPTPVFLPGESQGRGAWWAAIYGVAQSWTQLKRFSSSIRQWMQGYQNLLLKLIVFFMEDKKFIVFSQLKEDPICVL